MLERGREIWNARACLMTPVPGRQEPELEDQIRTDLIDIITIWAAFRVQTAPVAEQSEARREALCALDQAAATLGSSPSLERLRLAYGKALGRATSAADAGTRLLEPRTAWEHCDLGRAYLRDDAYARAAVEFQRAVDLRPHDFWPNFYQGLCAFKLGRFEDASMPFRVCISLAEYPAECYYNRALAYEALGRNDDAVADYTRALRVRSTAHRCGLEPGHPPLRRGTLFGRRRRPLPGIATATGRERRGVIYFNRALVSLARDDRPAALADLKAAGDCGYARARELSDRLGP